MLARMHCAQREGILQADLIPVFFFSSRRRHTRFDCDWSSDVCSSDLHQDQFEGSGRAIADSADVVGLVLVAASSLSVAVVCRLSSCLRAEPSFGSSRVYSSRTLNAPSLFPLSAKASASSGCTPVAWPCPSSSA